jgi:glycosyltransferase involved in cell wall biosynthesis
MHLTDKRPLISIITPSWNREYFLKKLADSLIAQSSKNFEWIVGNDGSTDNTDGFIKSLIIKKNFTIKYVASSLRIGKAAMDNILLDYVSGEYITWCGSDDILLPDAVENISKLITQIPKNEIKNYVGILAQSIDRNNKSQTFYENNIQKEAAHLKWESLTKIIKGDATIVERSELIKGNKFLEVDFLISETSFFNRIYKGKKFIVTPTVVKIMDRSANNSISFGKKLQYSRGSAYCIAIIETSINFAKYSIIKKIKVIINYWRYSIHGDIKFSEARRMLEPVNKNILWSLVYIISLILCLRDNLLGKVEKTHIDFEKNMKKKIITFKSNN